jgi:uncharacterized protein YkwD
MARNLWSTLLVCLLAAGAAAKTVEEKDEDGKLKRKYAVDAQGRRDGPYVEYDADGRVKLKAVYQAGKLNGPLSHYENGRAVRTQVFREGRPVYPRTVEQIREKVAEALAPAEATDDKLAVERDVALRRLKLYRYVVGVPADNLVLDDDLNRAAQAACRICAKLGRLDHRPPKVSGMTEAEYKLAYQGASRSNLAQGFPNLPYAVDGWLNDSDQFNIATVGHRRWCLNPALRKVGFGKVGQFSALYAADRSQRSIPDFDVISFPAKGLTPVELFRARYAWSVTLHPRKYRRPDKNVKPRIYAVDELLHKVGEPLALDHTSVNNDPYGLPGCIIFRPKTVVIKPGRRYLVVIDGMRRSNGRAAVVRFVVEFMRGREGNRPR